MSERVSLISGARGFVGAWLAKALLERGDRVVVLDPGPGSGRPSTLVLLGIAAEVVEVEADVRDGARCAAAIADHGVERVFHLAAKTIVGEAAQNPRECFDVNVRGTWELLCAAAEHRVEAVVVASSDKAYGAHEELPYREDFALRPTAPYEASKSAADLIARSFWHSHRLPVAVTRFANIYGGGDTNWSRLVPEAVSAAVDGRAPVLRSDGSPIRDFLYVEDCAAAYLRLAEALLEPADGVRGEAFNAGGERPYSVGEVVEQIAALAGTGVVAEVRGSGNPDGEIDRQYVDASRLRGLGWEPSVGLAEGLRRTVDWYAANPAVRPPQPD